MWQYCKWCKNYYNKWGCSCPKCFIDFAHDNSSLPDKETRKRLNVLWNEGVGFITHVSTMTISEQALS